MRLFGAVGSGKDLLHARAICIHVGEPAIAGSLVVPPIDTPVLQQANVTLKVSQEVIRRHDSAGEEIARHPVACVADVERIRDLAMREDVDENRTARSHPSCNALEEAFIVAHVLEHLDRDDSIELPPVAEREIVHVACHDLNVSQATRLGARLDELLLRA